MLNVAGPWRVYTGASRPVAPWEVLEPGQEVECLARTGERPLAKLEVLAGGAARTLNCEPKQTLPAPEAAAGISFLGAMIELINPGPALQTQAKARGSSAATDTLLCLDAGGTLDLTPALANFKARQLRLRFVPLEEPAAPPVALIDVPWNPPGPARIAPKAGPGVPRPGLYRLDVTTADDAERAIGSWIAVLITPAPHCGRATEAMRQARQIVARADPPLSAEAERSLYLLALAALEKE